VRLILRVLKWAGFLLLLMIILLTGWIGIRFLEDPKGTRDGLHMLYVLAAANHNPPPIAASGILSTGSDWMMPQPTGAKFTAILRKSFPAGSDEQAMRDALSDQGFEAVTESDCRKPGVITKLGTPAPHCRTTVVPRLLQYSWGGLPCSQTLRVGWTAGRHGRLVTIAGSYDAECL